MSFGATKKGQSSLLMPAAICIFCTLALKPYCNEPRRYCNWRNNNKTISNLCYFLWCFYLQLDQLKHRLSHVRECIGDANLYLLSMEDGINIDKLGQLGTITTTLATMPKSKDNFCHCISKARLSNRTATIIYGMSGQRLSRLNSPSI